MRDLLVLLGIFGLIWLGFSLFSSPREIRLFPVSREEKMGEAYMKLVRLNPLFTEFGNAKVDSVVGLIGERLESVLDHSEYHYTYYVFNSEMINAFTLPGGNILVSTGLIGFCKTPEELAAVLAHEMGHMEKRHVISRLVKELGIGIFTSGDPYVLGEVTGILTSAGFDRKQEAAADRFAAELLERASIEPRTLASLFRRLEEESGNELLEQFEILSSHPNFCARIREALSYQPEGDFKAVPIAVDWEGLKAQLD